MNKVDALKWLLECIMYMGVGLIILYAVFKDD